MSKRVFWAGFLALAAVLTASVLLWSTQSARAQEEKQAASAKPPITEQHAAMAASASVHLGPPIVAVTASGRPMRGVKVYEGRGMSYLGETNADGVPSPGQHLGPLLGVAPDGAVAISKSGRKLVFGATGTVRVHLKDKHGRATARKELTLLPFEPGAGSRDVGVLLVDYRVARDLRPALSRTTDASGNAEFPKLPMGMSFAVLAELDMHKKMAWKIAVQPGQSASLTLANDLKVTGHVKSASTPMAGVEVQLKPMVGESYSDTVSPPIAVAITDRSGAYRFDNLPNCVFNVRIGDLSKTSQKRGVIRSKVGPRPWSDGGYNGPGLPAPSYEPASGDLRGVDVDKGATFALRGPSTVCDFRVFNPAIVTLEFINAKKEALQGCSIFVSDPVGGSGADAGEDIGGRISVPIVLSPGKHMIAISRFADDVQHVLTRVVVKEGEDRHIRCTLPQGIASKPPVPGADAQVAAGYKIFDDYEMRGSDGRVYTVASLTAGKPVLFVNFATWDQPLAVVADINRLSQMLSGRVRVVGIVPNEPAELPKFIKRFGVKFLLVRDDTMLVQELAKGRSVYDLANMLVLPDRTKTHVWAGYNRWTLRQMEIDLRRTTDVRLSLDLSRFPKELQVGEGGMYGLPGP